jgi:hypothetical protein
VARAKLGALITMVILIIPNNRIQVDRKRRCDRVRSGSRALGSKYAISGLMKG